MALLILNKKHLVKVELCDTFFKKFKGLMFRVKPKCLLFILSKESILNASIHMIFVFFPIDVFWLDEDMKVIDFKLNVKPFTIWHDPKAAAKYILETSVGELKGLKLGNKLSVSPNYKRNSKCDLRVKCCEAPSRSKLRGIKPKEQ